MPDLEELIQRYISEPWKVEWRYRIIDTGYVPWKWRAHLYEGEYWVASRDFEYKSDAILWGTKCVEERSYVDDF